MNFLKRILEIIFPNHCLYCQQIISAEGLLCSCCWQKLQFITEPKCNICSNPFEFLISENLTCAACLKRRPAYDKAIVIFHYNEIIKKIISDLKYRDKTYIAKKLANFLINKAKKEIDEADFIIAVPLHKKRLRHRKFNQSLIIIQFMLKNISKRKFYPDFLLRIKNTTPQVALSKKQRQKNLTDAFIIKPKYREIVKNKNFLLIDDVITTGATLENCAKILKKSGAKKVVVLTIAKTVFN